MLAEGQTDSFDPAKNTLKIEALYGNIKAYINGVQVADVTNAEGEASGSAGRAALYSSYNLNCFDNLSIEPLGDEPYITRFDETDDIIAFTGEWEHNCMSSFKNYKRTISTGKQGAGMEISFTGTGLLLTGENKADAGEITVSVDGGEEKTCTIPKAGSREAVLMINGLEEGEHKAVISIKSGSLSVDAAEILGTSAIEDEEVQSDSSTAETENAKDSSNNKGGVKTGALVAGAIAALALTGAVTVIKKRRKKE